MQFSTVSASELGIYNRILNNRFLPVPKSVLPIVALILSAAVCASGGESVTLKTGEVIEGKIIYQTESQVVIDVQFSPTITDRRTISMSEVAGVQQLKPDEEAWTKIETLTLPSTALDAGVYTRVIEMDLRPFLQKYPYSDRMDDVRARIAAFEAERERVLEGDVKLDDVWLSPVEYEKEKYQVDARQIRDEMQRQMGAKRWTEALNIFNKLLKSFPNSIAFVEALPDAKRAIAGMEQQLTYDLRNLSATLAQRQRTLDLASRDQRPRVEAALKADEARAASASAKARDAGDIFFPIYKFDEKTLKEQLRATQQLAETVGKIEAAQLERGASLVKRANREIRDRDFSAAQVTLAALAETWADYEGLGRMQSRLEKAQEALKAASEHQADTLENERHLREIESGEGD